MTAILADYRLITGQLQIPVGQNIHDPDQGIEPMDTQHGRKQPLRKGIKPADMGHFMGQYEPHGLFIPPVRIRGQQDYRPKNPISKRRLYSVRTAYLYRPAQPVFLYPFFGKGVFHRQGGGIYPAPPQMHDKNSKCQQGSAPCPKQQPG